MGLFLLGRWIFSGDGAAVSGIDHSYGTEAGQSGAMCVASAAGNYLALSGVPFFVGTYGIANDFFFSGHTAIAVFAGLELAQFEKTMADRYRGSHGYF